MLPLPNFSLSFSQVLKNPGKIWGFSQFSLCSCIIHFCQFTNYILSSAPSLTPPQNKKTPLCCHPASSSLPPPLPILSRKKPNLHYFQGIEKDWKGERKEDGVTGQQESESSSLLLFLIIFSKKKS